MMLFILHLVGLIQRGVILNTLPLKFMEKQFIHNELYMNELEQDKRYVFGDMIIVATTDLDFNPILKISTDDGNVIVMPSYDNIIVKSTVDKC